MSGRPPVVRTYGKARPLVHGSSSSLIFETSPPSSPLITPHASSDTLETADLVLLDYGKENIFSAPVTATSPMVASKGEVIQSTLGSFFNLPNPKKRPLFPSTLIAGPSTSSSTSSNRSNDKRSIAKKAKISGKDKEKDKDSLTQMYLTHLPLLHTCSQCLMSYVRGAEDESLHEKHHARVTRGILWEGLGRGKGKGKAKAHTGSEAADCGWRVVRDDVTFGVKGKGKIVVADGSYGGSKLDDILKTVDTVLSSPPLPISILDQCKVFLFITSSPAPSKRIQPIKASEKRNPKERIVGVVVAQGIKWAMRVLKNQGAWSDQSHGEVVDSGDGVLCDSTRLPTPLGIHRLFTIPTYRSLGLAQILLDAACDNTVYGCKFSPTKGEVAFSQPTNSGRKVMEKWGKGEVRVFVDDESQL